MSQGDNWFVFHLLSANDLISLKRANSHFSDDPLRSLLIEPIPGQGVFWSSVEGKPYPISIRALSFEEMFPMRDESHSAARGRNFAATIANLNANKVTDESLNHVAPQVEGEDVDVKAQLEQDAIKFLKNDARTMRYLGSERGAAWGALRASLLKGLPDHIDNREQFAYNLVRKALDQLWGPDTWDTYKNEKGTTYVKKKPIE